MNVTRLLIVICIVGFTFSCEKENKLDDRTLSNSYEDFYNGLPEYNLITVDSNRITYFSSAAEIRIYFHIDFSKIYDTTMIDRVIYTRNNSSGYLIHGEHGYLYNIFSTPLASKYNYRLALSFMGSDSLISAYTPVYSISP